MDEKLEFGECYICLEDTPLLSQCLCKKRYLCENCMEKLRIYNYKKCTVCHATFPKAHELEYSIDIPITFEETIELDYSCTPCCLRPRRERNKPKYCCMDFTTHICCIYIFMLLSSCIFNPNDQCYGWNIVNYFFPSVVVYSIICTFLTVVRR